MSAPEGNQYWKKRSKHGRDRVIVDPVTLSEASDEYFQWCLDNPVIEIDFRGKDLTRIEIPHPRVFKKEELSRFCGLAQWRSIEELRPISEDFSQVITYIENIIRDQKYTYAVVGMFNSNIVSRDLGLVDNKGLDHTTNGNDISISPITWIDDKE